MEKWSGCKEVFQNYCSGPHVVRLAMYCTGKWYGCREVFWLREVSGLDVGSFSGCIEVVRMQGSEDQGRG